MAEDGGGAATSEVTAEAFAALQQELENTKSQLAEFRDTNTELLRRDRDFDKSEYTRLKALEEDLKVKEAETAQEWARAREELETKHAREMSEVLEREKAKDEKLDRYEIKEVAEKVARDNDMYITTSEPHFARAMRRDKDGNVVIVGLDGEPTDMEGLIEQFKGHPELLSLFKPNGQAGGGAEGRKGAGGAHKQLSEMSETEKMDYIDQHGIDAYKELLTAG